MKTNWGSSIQELRSFQRDLKKRAEFNREAERCDNEYLVEEEEFWEEYYGEEEEEDEEKNI